MSISMYYSGENYVEFLHILKNIYIYFVSACYNNKIEINKGGLKTL